MGLYFFINHTKTMIVKAGNDAKHNIGNNLFDSIRANKWSLSDKIEFIDLLSTSNIVLYNLVDKGNYICSYEDYINFNY